MNATGFSDDYNATFVGNESLDRSDVNHTGSFDYKYYDANMSWVSWSTIYRLRGVIRYVSAVLGIPGNILSAIVWLRLHVTTKNSSAVYLAVLAINDLLWTTHECLPMLIGKLHPSPLDVLDSAAFYWSDGYVSSCITAFEPLLVLGFSVERLIAIVRPLQVCRCVMQLVIVCNMFSVMLRPRGQHFGLGLGLDKMALASVSASSICPRLGLGLVNLASKSASQCKTSCRRAAATIFPRPGLQVVTGYTCTHMER